MTLKDIHTLVYDDAVDSLILGAPGLADVARRAVATKIAIRVSYRLLQAIQKQPPLLPLAAAKSHRERPTG